MKRIVSSFLIILMAFTMQSFAVAKKPTVGVVFSGSGIMDGTELSEAVLTMLYLEKSEVNIIYMAPNITQADTIDHLTMKPSNDVRNTLAESARISRGNIRDIAQVKSSELDVLIQVGGLGSIKNLSDFLAKGPDCNVNPDFERLIKAMWVEKKPIGSMCLASANLAKVLGEKKITLTIGKADGHFVPMLIQMGAIHKECPVDGIVVDQNNLIVTTPAMMIGPSTRDIAPGIEKMIGKVLEFLK
jgi:enhancing lycopene biosynthesis protein 2